MEQEDINRLRKQATDAWYSQKESLEGFDMQAHFESGYDAALDALAPTLIAQAERVKVLEEENARFETALKDVVNPLQYLRREAEAQGSKLSGHAYSVANGLGFVQSIARTALEQTGASNE